MIYLAQLTVLSGAIIVSTYLGYISSSYLDRPSLPEHQTFRPTPTPPTREILAAVNYQENQDVIVPTIPTTPSPTPQPIPAETPIPTASPEPTLTHTPISTPIPTKTPTPIPTPTLEPIPTATPTSPPDPVDDSTDIHQLTQTYADQYQVDANTLRHIAQCESGFNPAATNLDYAGLYQFSPGSWTNYRSQMGEDTNPDLRFNPAASIKTAAFVLSINRQYIWPSCLP